MQPLTERRVWGKLAGLECGPFGGNVHVYTRVGSTNDLAREQAEAHAPEGTVVLADEQTAGRGRLGRAWEAPPGTSLLFSVLFRPALPPERANRLVMACGLAVAEACEALAGVGVEVKWPNDLLIGGKKFTGILAESAIVGEALAWVVVGVGVNVNQVLASDDPLAETATSLRMATGTTYDRAALLAGILTRLNGWHGRLLDAALAEAWRARCGMLGQRVHIEIPGAALDGTAEALDEDGALLLRDERGVSHRVVAGEATVVKGARNA